MNSHIYLGIDLGKHVDHTALAAIEAATTSDGRRDPVTASFITTTRLNIRLLHRLPLGTPYPTIARIINNVLTSPPFQNRATAVIDASGPGLPFLDYFRPAANLVKVLITSSGKVTWSNGFHHVPRAALLHNLAILVEKRSLSVAPGLADAPALMKELSAINTTGKSRAPHDDLAMAAALAAWQAVKRFKPP